MSRATVGPDCNAATWDPRAQGAPRATACPPFPLLLKPSRSEPREMVHRSINLGLTPRADLSVVSFGESRPGHAARSSAAMLWQRANPKRLDSQTTVWRTIRRADVCASRAPYGRADPTPQPPRRATLLTTCRQRSSRALCRKADPTPTPPRPATPRRTRTPSCPADSDPGPPRPATLPASHASNNVRARARSGRSRSR